MGGEVRKCLLSKTVKKVRVHTNVTIKKCEKQKIQITKIGGKNKHERKNKREKKREEQKVRK